MSGQGSVGVHGKGEHCCPIERSGSRSMGRCGQRGHEPGVVASLDFSGKSRNPDFSVKSLDSIMLAMNAVAWKHCQMVFCWPTATFVEA